MSSLSKRRFEQLGPGHEVVCSNLTGGGIRLMTVWLFIAQSPSLSAFHHLDDLNTVKREEEQIHHVKYSLAFCHSVIG